MQKLTKKQHYIPRAAILRNFSDSSSNDDRKNKLNVYDKITRKHFVSNVYDCAYQNYLYESPNTPSNALEKTFADIENDFFSLTKQIINVCRNPTNKNALVLGSREEKENLKFFVVSQYWRTAKIRDSFNEAIYPDGQNAFLFQMIGRDAYGNIGLVHYANELKNHFFVFEVNITKTPFVLADHPVFVYNTENDGTENYRLPLSPWVHVLMLDSNGNEGKLKRISRNRIIQISNPEYVKAWNERSALDAYRQLYFLPGHSFDSLIY